MSISKLKNGVIISTDDDIVVINFDFVKSISCNKKSKEAKVILTDNESYKYKDDIAKEIIKAFKDYLNSSQIDSSMWRIANYDSQPSSCQLAGHRVE